MSCRLASAMGGLVVLAFALPGLAPDPAPALVPRAEPAVPGGGSSGFEKLLQQQAKLAKAAVRGKDWELAERAWGLVLELDARSLAALEGLAEVARAKGDPDAEAFTLVDLVGALEAEIAAGEAPQAKRLQAARARLAAVDPRHERTAELLAEYGRAQEDLARRYASAGFTLNALEAWGRRLASCGRGSVEAAVAHAELARLLAEAPDDVARSFTPPAAPPARDAEWIAAHDARTAKWSSAARWETPHYRIKTNAGWLMGTEIAGAMEAVHAFYREIWGIAPDPPRKGAREGLRELSITPIEVNVYASIDEYRRRAGSGEKDWSGGNYTGSAVNSYDHSQKPGEGSRATLATLFHEASHQFMHVAVGDVPSFVNEGVADLFMGIEILSNGGVRRDLPVPGRLAPLADEIRAGTAMPLRGVMNALENNPELYAARWGFFYFLRMYVDERGEYVFRERLEDYIYEFKRGSPGDMVEHFQEFVLDHVKAPGLETFARFEAKWHEWILALDEELRSGDRRLEDYRGKARMAALKGEHEVALNFHERALDIDPDDLDSLHGAAEALATLERKDRAASLLRRFLERAPEGEKRRTVAAARLAALDPEHQSLADARRALAGGMAALALEYDAEAMPRMAMRAAREVLAVEPFEPSSRALVARLERETGLSARRWERLFNGFDLEGWYGTEGGGEAFHVETGVLICDSRRVGAAAAKGAKGGRGGKGAGAPPPAADDGILYHALLLDRAVDGDWSAQATIATGEGWRITGLIFGARDTEHYEAIVLRNKGADGVRVEFGSYDGGAWSFRGDGSFKAEYDAEQGVVLRVDVRGRDVAVSIDGRPVEPVVGGRAARSIQYPLAALRGDIGLLGSRGVTRYTDVLLLAGRPR